jgi:hypothetical protein
LVSNLTIGEPLRLLSLYHKEQCRVIEENPDNCKSLQFTQHRKLLFDQPNPIQHQYETNTFNKRSDYECEVGKLVMLVVD